MKALVVAAAKVGLRIPENSAPVSPAPVLPEAELGVVVVTPEVSDGAMPLAPDPNGNASDGSKLSLEVKSIHFALLHLRESKFPSLPYLCKT